MKIIKQLKIIVLALGFISISSCELEGGESLNGTSTTSISGDLSRGELPQAMSGILSEMRIGLRVHVDVQSAFGREYYYLTGSDPRWEGDVVTGNLDNNTFYATTVWAARYGSIKAINFALEGLANTTSDFSPAEIAGIRGVLNTLKAYELLSLTNNQFDNGIRTDVVDPDNVGPLVNNMDALTEIFGLLDNAATDLAAAGASLPFNLSSGYEDFDTPAGFLKFNKGLTARVEAYRGNFSNVITLLQDSFMDMAGDMDTGIYHTFSLTGADLPNDLFGALNQTAIVRVSHSSFTDDALPNDLRVDKVVAREAPTSASGLTGTHDVWLYQSNVDNIPIIRNEELILLAAEANIIANPNASVSAINIVREAAGIGAYTGGQTPIELEDEILFQRRYSLFGEGHRWIDMRRLNRLNELPNDRAIDNVPMGVPVPFTDR